MARREADNLSDVDDVVAEAFLAVLVALEAGKGPNAYFRSYVLTTTRRMAHQRNAGARHRAAFDRDRALAQTSQGGRRFRRTVRINHPAAGLPFAPHPMATGAVVRGH
ncbi:sigma factor [Paenarthrobacter ureafaciens]